MVREGKTRTFTCECGAVVHTFRLTGRLPVKCEDCDWSATTWQRERSEAAMRAAIVELADRVDDLEDLIESATAEAERTRARRFGTPDRRAVRRAVMAVAHARGARATADALLDLAAVAKAWAAVILSTSPRGLAADAEDLAA